MNKKGFTQLEKFTNAIIKNRFMSHLRKRNSLMGFTLIELLITIAIIGILAGVAVTAYVGSVKKAARSEAYSNLESLRLLEEQFFAENGEYTASKGTCAADNPGNIGLIKNPPDALPGFRPGTELSYSYCIVQNQEITDIDPLTYGDLTPCFTARAYGNTNTRVAGDVFAIDCNNNRNF